MLLLLLPLLLLLLLEEVTEHGCLKTSAQLVATTPAAQQVSSLYQTASKLDDAAANQAVQLVG
jgi:hypothetical protein